MVGNPCGKLIRAVGIALAALLAGSTCVHAQNAPPPAASSTSPAPSPADVQSLATLVRELQAQVQTLNSQITELRAEEQRTQKEARELRTELDSRGISNPNSPPSSQKIAFVTPLDPYTSPKSAADPQNQSTEERFAKIEEDQQLLDAKINEQSQTKVESGSKYRVRLSGIVLLNLFENRGVVDNIDFPEIAESRGSLDSAGTFGGSLRQSQIGLEVFGPDIAGAHTSANIKFDFAGGFPDTPNGTELGIVRLRTGTIRLDWTNTSLVAGQDYLFFAPLTPTSLASLALPALSYSGNLWGWTPQVRIEHRVHLSQTSGLLFEGGILDSLSGDIPYDDYERYPSWGEESGQPAYAGRIAWNHSAFGRNLIIGAGGYYGRQYWGFGRNVNGWASTFDVTMPLGKYFDVSGEFYRGRALGGLGGGIGQDVLLSGPLTSGSTVVQGLDSMGGWTQLKFKPRQNFEVNGALGLDNPFASELRRFPSSTSYYGSSLSKNLSPLVNFIYTPRSNVMFSVEYRRLRTFVLDNGSNTANQIGTSIEYKF